MQLDSERSRKYLEQDPATLSEDELREAMGALQVIAERDPLLTTMLNKAAMAHRVEKRINERKKFGVFLIDINNFKKINDTYGHDAGDDLLRLIEALFGEHFHRKGDNTDIGRIGGDEFLVIMVELGDVDPEYEGEKKRTTDPYEQMDNIYNLLKRIEQKLIGLHPHAAELEIGFSIGPAMFDPDSPVDAKTLMMQADEAMYEEKPENSR